MKSLEDQLKAIGLIDLQETAGSAPKQKTSFYKSSHAPKPILELPLLGRVTQVDEGRGFGFVAIDGGREELFFHLKGYAGRHAGAEVLPPPNTPLLFIIGRDRRRPTRREVVRWYPVAEVAVLADSHTINQKMYDALRRDRLKAMTADGLWHLLRADWYCQQWGDGAPADLDDPELEAVWKARLREIESSQLGDGTFWDRLSHCRYEFAARLHPGHPHRAFDLNLFEPHQLAALGAPNPSWMKNANDALQLKLLEWRLLRKDDSDTEDKWRPWFQGTKGVERELATKLLGQQFQAYPFVDDWLAKLARNALLSPIEVAQWAETGPATALTLFEYLPQESKSAYFAAWRAEPEKLIATEPYRSRLVTILTSEALAIDLETDGESIWEVGCARGSLARRIHDQGSEEQLVAAMAELELQIRSAPLLVGHNFLAWDWPIIQRFISPASPPPIWDTLLTQFLIAPQSQSHALGGNHRADGDAQATRELFEEQISNFTPDFARSILAGEFDDAGQIIEAMPSALAVGLKYARDMPPDIAAHANPHDLLILPREQVRAFDWVPHVTVVPADPAEGLPPELRQIDVGALERNVQDAKLYEPVAKVVVAVVRMAADLGIAIRRNMIPFWLLEGNPALASAIDGAAVTPHVEGGWRVAPIPARPEWWRGADLESYCLAAGGQDVLVLSGHHGSLGDISQRLQDSRSASLIRLRSQDGMTDWAKTDRAAYILERRGGLQCFTTWRLPNELRRLPRAVGSGASARIRLATRRDHVLHPGSMDQLGYWSEVLRAFREICRRENRAIPMLIISSSGSLELVKMIEVALAELGLGEARPDHRSKREHLLRASRRGYAVVDTLDNWPSWLGLAQSADIVLQPVVDALPLEEWFAYSQANGDRSESSQLPDDEAVEVEDSAEANSWGTGAILEAMPSLVAEHLADWLVRRGLSNATLPSILIDPRLSVLGRGLTANVDVVPLHGTQLSKDELQRLEIVLSPFKLVREAAPTDFASMERFFVENWNAKGGSSRGVQGFKESQRSAMEAICARTSHVLVSLPTGEGKSVLFQVPALSRGLRSRRLTLVISPLKALMRDQVEGLRDLGFAESADFLSGDRPKHEIEEILQGVLDHRVVLLYVTAERLRSAAFLDVLDKRMRSDGGLDHVVIDEAHCVNQWGFEFRPDYFFATELLLRKCREIPGAEPTPFLLLSATITASDKERLEAIVSGMNDAHRLPMLVRPEAFAHPIRSHISILPRRMSGQIGQYDLDREVAARLPIIEKAISAAKQNRLNTGQRSAVIVFVPTRRLAEYLARRLSNDSGADAEFYHGGLDAATKDEVYADFREGDLDVLVATKAFGMGMDIPDIHWVVHLSPPGYLEDYLQEVGRIGRGEAEREKARLTNLSALLPFSNEDFEHIRDLRARNALRPQDIDDIFSEIRGNAHSVDGKLLAIVPAEGYQPLESETERRAAATRLRMAIYWLERAGRLTLSGSLADILTIGVSPRVLERIAHEEGPLGELAQLLLDLENADTEILNVDDRTEDCVGTSRHSGLLGRLLNGLADIVGLVFNGPPQQSRSEPLTAPASRPETQSARAPGQSDRTAVINLSQIRFRLQSMGSNDDVLAGLVDLEKRGGVSLNRKIEFSLRRLARDERDDNIRALFRFVDAAARQLLGQLANNPRLEFHPLELVEIEPFLRTVAVEGAAGQDDGERKTKARKLAETDEEAVRRRRRYERAFINGFRTLARSSGVRLRQIARADETVCWEAKLSGSEGRNADLRRKALVRAAQSVFDVLKKSDERIAVSKLIESVRDTNFGKKFREQDLKKTAGILAAMNLVGMSVDLVQFSHIVLLDESTSDDEALWTELAEINDFSEARNLAMELFANLRTDAQEAFITGYFSKSNASGLKDFLETQLGEIDEIDDDDEEGAPNSSIIAQMQEKLRATKAVEFFEKFKASEEPAQWEAVRNPYNQHLLVNAGPGAGKTFVLVGRIVHLIREQQIHPSQIIVLAFNRAVVFEIKRRIRDLFKSLGYAAYASRLRVSTIHAFAMGHLAKDGWQGADSVMDEILTEFARRMENDAGFRRAVAGDVRCILVDEFQDLTDDVYAILRALHRGSDFRAGVMVIGDDDQDILRWQRPAGNFSETYFDRFKQDFGGENLRQLLLSVNFRSGAGIVEKSQAMIGSFFDRSACSQRLKKFTLVPRQEAALVSECRRIDWRGKSFGDAVHEVLRKWNQIGGRSGETVAVLCRSNAEVAQVHRLLEPRIAGITVQGTANLRVANLRHVGLWLDFLRAEVTKSDRALSAQLADEFVDQFIRKMDTPECNSAGANMVSLASLWELCCQEQAFPHISSLIRFVEELRSDDLSRLKGATATTSTVVLSTIHKVKGLEFDNVVILPSGANFPISQGGGRRRIELEGDAAEEARLLYVAMTRAKRNLWQFVGDREHSWAKHPPVFFKGENTEGRVLIGSPEDVALGWALTRMDFNPDPDKCQGYIEREVKVGDPVLLGGRGFGENKSLFHRSRSGQIRQIGFLAKKHGAGSDDAELRVSSVIRFHPKERDAGDLGPIVTARGWGHVVLVSGRIR